MTATTRTCVIITCDVCYEPWSGDSTYHWESIGDARTAASPDEGWVVFSDGTAICGKWTTDHDDYRQALRPKLTPSCWDEIVAQHPSLADESDEQPDFTTWTAADGTVYDLTKKWRDRHGRVWTYGEHASHAFHEPCMITDDPGNGVGTPPWLVREGADGAGPLTLVNDEEA